MVLTLTLGSHISVRSWEGPGALFQMVPLVAAFLLLPWLSEVMATNLSDKFISFISELQVSQRQLGGVLAPRLTQQCSGSTRDPINPKDSWRISSEVGCVCVEEKQNQFLGTTLQQECFLAHPKVAWLQDPGEFLWWEILVENGKTFENWKCHFGAFQYFKRRKYWEWELFWWKMSL